MTFRTCSSSRPRPAGERYRSRLCVALLAVTPGAPAAQESFPPDSAIRAILRERVASERAVGLVVATYAAGAPPRIFAHGSSGRAGVPLDANAVFEIGSITKVFTTSAFAAMVARGTIRLDDPVAKYLPPSVRMPMRGGKQITLAGKRRAVRPGDGSGPAPAPSRVGDRFLSQRGGRSGQFRAGIRRGGDAATPAPGGPAHARSKDRVSRSR